VNNASPNHPFPLPADNLPQSMQDLASGNAVTVMPANAPSETAGITVKAGARLPPAAAVVPQLVAQQAVGSTAPSGQSAIAAGMSFQGNAVIQGGCMIAGSVVGNVSQAEGAQVSVTITETGHLKGDVKAHQIVVMGRTHGLLDASSGMVTLHESSNVQGHVRYAKLQVNGAELNATLEKAPAPSSNGR
jgi:cytoskeletal protein CcmA (bactofilin family)